MGKCLLAVVVFGCFLASGCGYNAMQAQDEQIKSAWSEVLNQYQRRADLIPNLVNTVKGYATQESTVLLGVTEARAKVGSIQATPELVNDPAAFAKFTAAPIRTSATCRRSSRVRRTASPSPAIGIFRRCRRTTSRCVRFPAT